MITSTQLLREIAADNPFQPATSIWRAVELALIINTPFPEGRGLDLGCGDGAILQRILKYVGPREVVGIDLDPRETEAAVDLGLYSAVHTGPGSEIPELDASFDFVFSNSVLEHIPDLSPVFAEVARVLKPGGIFYFTVPSTTFPDLLYGPWLPGADRQTYNEMVTRRIAVEHYFSIEQCAEWMDEAGLRLDETIPYFSRKVTRRWEFVARITSGILYQIAGMRKQPIEIQHRLNIRTRRGGVLAKLAVAAVMFLGTGALKDDDGPRHGYGGYLFIVRKPAT
jgi:SAM-dependent methyltransferase